MAQPLPRLRLNLDFTPSPAPEHPGLFIRDPFRFSERLLIIPPMLVECLQCFDGQHTDLDLRAALVRLTGDFEVGQLQQHLIDTLSEAGFLEDERFARMEQESRRDFREAAVRQPAHAGSAYPAESGELRETMTEYMSGEIPLPAADGNLLGIAAPHVSPSGGWQSYRAAYRMLGPEHHDRTFVILGTSHYGAPERFGLTRKNFLTPFGEAMTDQRLVDWLAARAPGSIEMEDYCHSFEHTVEFQVVFLQQVLGPSVRILPILCGAFVHSLFGGGSPEQNDGVRAFLEALGELHDRESGRLFWVLGVDMAHMGIRYGDQFQAEANSGEMVAVSARDEARIARIKASDAAGFWELVRENRDDLKWCGSSPFYTFLKAVPRARGELLNYEQWNIDEQSVVSFAGMAFSK
ncbi:MAG TPA: AmmeMemoRadiSam system protein B [Bryobacteraceae bacterium]|nr:AmmeMemoRadiSam system protein B [Bryobacteraceae bacterium]